MKTLLAAAPAALLVMGIALFLLDANLAYQSPLAGPGPTPPRLAALADLDAWREARAEEEARRKAFLADLDTTKMVSLGREIVHGRGLCFNCHRIGSEGRGTQGPDLAGVGARAGARVPGMSDVEYLAQSLYEPRAFVVDGFAATMTPADADPIDLNDLDILMVVAYLQSLGATPTVTPETDLGY